MLWTLFAIYCFGFVLSSHFIRAAMFEPHAFKVSEGLIFIGFTIFWPFTVAMWLSIAWDSWQEERKQFKAWKRGQSSPPPEAAREPSEE